jgi:uncharacterized protein DUF4136
MPTRRLALVLLATLGVAWTPQSLEPEKVEVEYDHSTDFSAYKTYAWVPFLEPSSNAANHVRITRAVEQGLEAKGLTKVKPADASVLLHYYTRLDKKVRGNPSKSSSYWAPSSPRFVVNFDKVEVGTLVLEMWDGRRKDVVWQGKVSDVAPRPDQVEEAIDKAVTRILAVYPPKPEKASGP